MCHVSFIRQVFISKFKHNLFNLRWLQYAFANTIYIQDIGYSMNYIARVICLMR